MTIYVIITSQIISQNWQKLSTGIVGSGLYPIFDKERQFPFNAWYPFDVLQHGTYEMVYFHQFVCVMLIGGLNMYCDVLLTAMATFVGLQCEVLCLRLGKVGTFSDEKNRPYFIKCVQHHTLILNLLETLNKLFGTIYFWQICFGTMTLCMDLFLLSLSTPNSVEFFYLILYQLAIGNLILVPCWFATEMTRKSEDISMAAYASNWFDFNSNFKKDLAFFIMRSQKPLKLYAANFFEVSVVTFVKIIRSSFSYYAALSNLNT
ncbi:odorant receptor 30a-like [Sitophilus oryzae]|uniref:Odorant receptor 30a-like n=1 Tax=Sitophilus oryzae TaxID=7048 RepID=A0A6J2YE36_SITOR|nr:odorant receptor 30a-like [Sitophilus oryzae]